MITLAYNNFIGEADEAGTKPKFVKGEKKLMKLFISSKFENILREILKTGDFQAKAVSNKILELSQTDNFFDISYIDVDPYTDDNVSFMPTQRAWFKMGFANQEKANETPDPNCEMWTGVGRQIIGIGKLVNRLFDDFSDAAVDKFIRTYKAEIAASILYNSFEIVTGEKIRYWYSIVNCVPEGGIVGSCMRHFTCQPYFNIYVENPFYEVPPGEEQNPLYKRGSCGMLILTNNNNKLIGRALVWKGLRKPTDKTFMDRIYVVDLAHEELFKKYAIEQGWIFKYNQSSHDASYVDNGVHVNSSISIQLIPKKYQSYPYMDTLKYYSPGTGRLASYPGNPVEGKKRLKLESGEGHADNID